MSYDEATNEMNKLYIRNLVKIFIMIPVIAVGIMILVLNYFT